MSVIQYLRPWLPAALLIFVANSLLAQERPDFVSKDLIDAVFEGGNAGYADYFEQNLDFPKNSYKDQIEGLLLFKFTIDTEKPDIEVKFFTKLDRLIEAGIKATVQATRSKWKFVEPGKYTVYQPIVFSLLPYYPQTLEGDLPPLPAALPFKYQQLFVLIKSKRIPEDFDLENASEEEASERIKTMYIRTQAAYEKSLAAGNTETAYLLLNKLIRYNPLKKEYLMKRIQLEQALDVNDYQVYDAHLLNDFVATFDPNNSFDTSAPTFDARGNFNIEEEDDEKSHWKFFEKAYEGVQSSFTRDMFTYYHVPNRQYLAYEIGVILLEIKSRESGKIETNLLTSFGAPASKGLENALKVMSLNWVKQEEPLHKVLPLFIGGNELISETIAMTLQEYAVLENDIFLNPMQLTAMSINPVYAEDFRVSEERKQAIIEQSELHAAYGQVMQSYIDLMAKGKTKKAVEALNAVIRVNPFSIELVEKRADLDDRKTKAKYAKYDEALLAFLRSLK